MDTSSTTREQKRNLRNLWQLVDGIEIAMMTTVDHDGTLHSRPMATQSIEAQEYLWFFAARDSGKVKSIEANPNVSLVYAEPARNRYVSAEGRARINQDSAHAERLWNSAAQAWFPGGPEDAKLVLIEVDVDKAEWWDGMKSERVDLG